VLGPIVGPSAPSGFQLLRPAAADPGGPLVADVMIDEAGTQRGELWTSTDGRAWRSLGVISTYPEPSVFPVAGPGGGYLGTGDDLRLHVSTTGAEWSVVDGLTGLHASVDANGRTQMMSVTADTVFYVDLPLSGARFMWVMNLDDPVGKPSASPPDG